VVQRDEHDDERNAAAREAYPCPDCTANRGEECREHDGSPVEGLTHPARIERYEREQESAKPKRTAAAPKRDDDQVKPGSDTGPADRG
jgi:hypothetical protein